MAHRLAAALREWARLLGPAAVVSGGDLIEYSANVTAYRRVVHAALRIRSRDQIPDVVRIARDSDIALYPISTGRNWGLGSRLPVRDGAVIVDLSGLNRIIALDRATGTAFIEAGVTQAQLAEYLDREAPELVANMTGSAAGTSVVGNTLDRGIGYLAPRPDDLAGLEVVLGTGRILRIGEWHITGGHHGPHWRHGIGPSLQGLFVQSNLGIVTAAAVRLRRRPAATVAFRASVGRDEQVVDLLDSLAGLYGDAVLTLPCRTFDSTWMHGAPDGAGPAWTVFGGIAGRPAVVEALVHELRQGLNGLGDLELATIGSGSPEPTADDSSESSWWRSVLSVMGGHPTDLSVTNWASRIGVQFRTEDLDATDFGMLCDVRAAPFDGTAGHDAATVARKICAGYSLRPCISLSALDAHTLEAVFILLFNRSSEEQRRSAHACAEELRGALTAAGLVPHRVSIEAIPEFVSILDEYWQTVASIKQSLDPARIIAPGRYNAL